MSGLIEQLKTLRAVGVDGNEKQLQLLLRTANYNVERAINQYFDSGLPDLNQSSFKSGPTLRVENRTTTDTSSLPADEADQVIGNNAPVTIAPPPLRDGPPLTVLRSVSIPENKEPGWPKFVGERWVTGYSTRQGNIEHREYVAIVSEGSGISSQRSGKRKVGCKGSGAQQSRRSQKGGAALGRYKGPSAGAMAHILFRSSKGGVEGRLPREVCAFLAPLLQKGLVRAHAEAVCDLPGLGVFAEVPLALSLEVEEGLFALDHVEDEELYRSAYALLEFAHTGHIEQEQPKVQQVSPQDITGADSRPTAFTSGSNVDQSSNVAPATADSTENEDIWEAKEGEAEKEVRDEDVKELYDDEAQLCGMPEAPDPKLFVEGLTLRRYQRQALAWMVQREKRRLLTEEEDCIALSLGESSARPVEVMSVSNVEGGQGGGGDRASANKSTKDGVESVAIRGGRVHAASWESPASGGDCGGGPGVPMHPLWERRAVASLARKSASPAAPPPNSTRNDKFREGLVGRDGEAGYGLSHPVAFYVNVYSRRFQREFPQASLGCRGGILADEMGMGKTVMLLSLILADKERQQQGHNDEDSEGEDKSIINITSAPIPAAEKERGRRSCSGQQESLPLLPKAVVCSQKKGELAGYSNGNISPSSGGGEQGQKRKLDAASVSAFAAFPETTGTKRKREASKIDLTTSPGDSVVGLDEGVAAMEHYSSSSITGSRASSSDDTDEDDDPDFELYVPKSKKVRRTPAPKRSPEADKPSESEETSAGKKKLGGRWGSGKAGSDPSALLQDPYFVAQKTEGVKGREKDGMAVANQLMGGYRPTGPGSSEANGGTLVVCPLSLIGQWRGEIESKTRKGAITVCFHYGSGRNSSVRDLCRFDVVLTTYGVVSSEMVKYETDIQARAITVSKAVGRDMSKRRPGAGLLGLRWRRVILDEAHSIRNTATEQSRACLLLEAEQRWAVTGTPIQNSLDDVAALLAFLRHEPWSDRGWWRKVIADPYKGGDMDALRRLKTVLAPIMLRRTKKTLDSRGRPIVELTRKEVEIVRLEFSPMERGFYEALKQRSKVEFEGYMAAGTVMKSYIAILTLLLRLRQACNHPFLVLGRESPAVVASVGKGELNENPMSNHSSKTRKPSHALGGCTSSKSGADLVNDDSTDVALEGAGDAGGKTPRYVEELYRRYICRQPEVDAEGRRGSLAFVDSVVEKLREDGDKPSAECPVCMEEPMIAPALTTCAHIMCRACLQCCLRREACCPVCRIPMKESEIIDVSESQTTQVLESSSITKGKAPGLGVRSILGMRSARASEELGSGDGGGWMESTKLERLVMELQKMKRDRAGAKAVVFSQWRHMLDLAERSLSRGGWTFRRLDGAMTQQKRESALKSFSAEESVTVMLVSLKAGGVGLNLTAASTVILLDPWWNPAVEEQAIDRIHRLGQLNDVSVKRFVVSETVEDKMLALQEMKGRMAKSALESGSLGESQKLRVEDLVQFFK